MPFRINFRGKKNNEATYGRLDGQTNGQTLILRCVEACTSLKMGCLSISKQLSKAFPRLFPHLHSFKYLNVYLPHMNGGIRSTSSKEISSVKAASKICNTIWMRYEGDRVVWISVERHHLHPDAVVSDEGQVVLNLV